MTQAFHLVSCVGQKQSRICAAADLYTSDWFRKARRYVETVGGRWYILSAEHGLVSPSQEIAPYERTLNTMRIAERQVWAARVFQQIQKAEAELSEVIFLAGMRYREFLVPLLEGQRIAVTVPMAQLPIGKQLSWLDRHTVWPAPRS